MRHRFFKRTDTMCLRNNLISCACIFDFLSLTASLGGLFTQQEKQKCSNIYIYIHTQQTRCGQQTIMSIYKRAYENTNIDHRRQWWRWKSSSTFKLTSEFCLLRIILRSSKGAPLTEVGSCCRLGMFCDWRL